MNTPNVNTPKTSDSSTGAVIKCAGCQNIFRARPREAVCPKCKRPANRPLPILQKTLSAVFFPWGWIQAALLRASQPYAAGQAALLGTVGAVVWGGLYLMTRGG